jgi:hypothetical protein
MALTAGEHEKNPMKLSSLFMPWTLFASLWSSAAFAHHSYAMFEQSRTDTIGGTVQRLELVNPHAWLRVMVRDAEGHTQEWSIEMGGPNQMRRAGVTPDAVHAGDKVQVQIHPLRDGSYGGEFVSLTLPNGQVLREQGRVG